MTGTTVMRTMQPTSRTARKSFSGWTLALPLISALVVALVAWGSYALLEGQHRKGARDQLAMVADLKANQIATWLEFEKMGATAFSRGTAMSLVIEQWLVSGHISPELLERSRQRILTIAKTNHYVEVTVFKTDGIILLSNREEARQAIALEPKFLQEVLRAGAPRFAPFQRRAERSRETHLLDLVTPMVAVDAAGSRVVAFMLLRINPNASLFAQLKTWPIATLSSETVLAERVGDEVVLLNIPRQRNGGSSAVVLPISARDRLIVQATMGHSGLLEGLDCNGVPVLGTGRAVPGTPWFVLVKQDKAESHQFLWSRTLLLSILIVFCVLMAVVAVWSWMQRRSAALVLAGEARYKELFESISDAVFIVGPEGKFVEVNQVACNRLGFRRTQLLALGPSDIEERTLVHSTRGFWSLLGTDDQTVFETQHVRSDGTTLPVEVHARSIELKGQRVTLLSARDVTERKKSEALQRAEDCRLRALMTLHESDTQAEEELTYLSAVELARLTGSEIAYLVLLDPKQEKLPPGALWTADRPCGGEDDATLVVQTMERLRDECLLAQHSIARHEQEAQLGLRAPSDNCASCCSTLSVPVFDKQAVIAVAVVAKRLGNYAEDEARQLSLLVSGTWNLVQRRRAEQRLVKNERFLKTIADAVPGVVGYWTRDLHCTFANPGYFDWFGRTPEDMLGVNMIEFMGLERYRLNEAEVQGVLAGAPQRFELTMRKSDDSMGHALVHYIPDFMDGAVQGFFALASDITEIKLAQLQLETLNFALKERTRQAELANNAKSEFLANMSHEIRTPMNAILGLTHLMLTTSLTDGQRDYLSRIQDSSQLLLGLLNDILDLSRVEAGGLQLECAEFDLRKLLTHATGLIADRACIKGLKVNIEVHQKTPCVLLGDSLRLSQVIINLANNALKFTEHGSISLSVRPHEWREQGVVVRFTVQDTGIGISPQALPRLFQSFCQADSSTTRRFGGSGLGLAISKHLVELMGGAITVESEEGTGSTFTVTLPFGLTLSQSSGWQSSETRPVPKNSAITNCEVVSRPQGRAHILLAEDNENNRIVAGDMLELEGYDVECACNGREAVEMVLRADAHFDLILMDVQMPVLDGLSATREIRKEQKSVPIVAMTAHVMQAERQRCLDAGMSDHVSKPFDPDALRATLARWLPPGSRNPCTVVDEESA